MLISENKFYIMFNTQCLSDRYFLNETLKERVQCR